MKLGWRKKLSEDSQGSVGVVESDAGASELRQLPIKRISKGRVPPTYESTEASHDPALYYQVQDEDGKVSSYFETHPAGSRKLRRHRRRHDPKYHKKATGGRDWQIVDRDRQRELNEDKSLSETNSPSRG